MSVYTRLNSQPAKGPEANRISFVMLDNKKVSGAHQYKGQWQAFRKRQARLFGLLVIEFAALIPCVAIVDAIVKRLLPVDRLAFVPAFVLFGAVYVITLTRLRSFPCPRCGKNFYGGFLATSKTVWARNCANCGLLKFERE